MPPPTLKRASLIKLEEHLDPVNRALRSHSAHGFHVRSFERPLRRDGELEFDTRVGRASRARHEEQREGSGDDRELVVTIVRIAKRERTQHRRHVDLS